MRVFTIILVVMVPLVLGSTVSAAAQEYRSHGTWRRDGHRIEVLIEGIVRLAEFRDEPVAPSPGSRLLLLGGERLGHGQQEERAGEQGRTTAVSSAI